MTPRTAALIVLAGLAIGVLTVLGQGHLPGQWSTLANSGAVWLVVAFVAGSRMPTDGWAAAAGVAILVGAVIGYYVSVPIIVEGAAANMRSVAIWTGTALVGGPVYGVAGRWWRDERPTRRAIAVALLGGILVAEGLYDVVTIRRIRTAGWAMIAAGLAAPIVLGRSARERLTMLAAMVPVVLVAFGAYRLINWSFTNL